MREFWLSSGYRLLDRDEAGGLVITDAFLSAYLARPEMLPPDEACPAERALHAALTRRPRLPVAPEQLSALADPDARENYAVWLAFRNHLLSMPTLEAAYLSLFDGRVVPSLFLDQLVHVIARHMLEDVPDPMQARAAELLFRPQRVSIGEGGIRLADEEVVEMRAMPAGGALPGGAPPRSIELDVLSEEAAEDYWGRSERFDTVLDIGFGRPGLDALCRVLERWVRHLLGLEVRVQPVQSIRDERWVWHVGLDAEASAILNEAYEGGEIEEARMAQVLSLFRLDFADPSDMLERVAGRPVYLALAQTPRGRLRLKPQNLLMNLPLAAGRGS